MIVAVVYVNKVTHMTLVKHPIPEIAANTGSKQRQSNVNKSMLTRTKQENHRDHYQCDN